MCVAPEAAAAIPACSATDLLGSGASRGAIPVVCLMPCSWVVARLGTSTPRLWAVIGIVFGSDGSRGVHASRLTPRRGNMHIGHGVSAALRQRVAAAPSADSPQVRWEPHRKSNPVRYCPHCLPHRLPVTALGVYVTPDTVGCSLQSECTKSGNPVAAGHPAGSRAGALGRRHRGCHALRAGSAPYCCCFPVSRQTRNPVA